VRSFVVGQTVEVLPSRFGWDAFKGPATVLDSSKGGDDGAEVLVEINGVEIWFVVSARIAPESCE